MSGSYGLPRFLDIRVSFVKVPDVVEHLLYLIDITTSQLKPLSCLVWRKVFSGAIVKVKGKPVTKRDPRDTDVKRFDGVNCLLFCHVLTNVSAIAILTYNRFNCLFTVLKSIQKTYTPLNPSTRVGIFEDFGYEDHTVSCLNKLRGSNGTFMPELQAHYGKIADGANAGIEIFTGSMNVGVAGNSNRAIRWFMEHTDQDHLLLMNDDVLIKGDVASAYRQAHKDLGVELFCFCDFKEEEYRWASVGHRGYKIKLLPRKVGMVLSLTRSLIEKIGYFDTTFGPFGEEHNDFTNRARFAGGLNLDGQPQHCLDIEQTPDGVNVESLLSSFKAQTSLSGPRRAKADAHGAAAMKKASMRYGSTSWKRDFSLITPVVANSINSAGIPVKDLPKMPLVISAPSFY